MSRCAIIDTFPAFLSFWECCHNQSFDIQVAHWEEYYMAEWPELFMLQKHDYAKDGKHWKDIARTRIFPFLSARLPAIRRAHRHLLAAWHPIAHAAQTILGFETDVVCVVYVGLGCGAGWVTPYAGSPAVLFGLEMMAECGWVEPPSLIGLVAHELGHVAQNTWRSEYGATFASGPWWQLFCEGFAQRCEHVILGEDTWHEQAGLNDDGWLAWCEQQTRWLAAEFLRRVDNQDDMRPFFGSWFDIQGWRQCGYFLGHELIRTLEHEASLKEIAIRDDIEDLCRSVLVQYAGKSDR